MTALLIILTSLVLLVAIDSDDSTDLAPLRVRGKSDSPDLDND